MPPEQVPPAPVLTRDNKSLAELLRLGKLLSLQVVHTQRTEALTAYLLEEQIVARNKERLGPKAIGTTLSHVYSQNYEDAMIEQIFVRVGAKDRTFVEIGVENGIECNTRLLLQQGWRGVWLEASETHCNAIRERFASEISSGQLVLTQAFVTRENINDLVQKAGFGGGVDFLSVDIDRNTHHVWRALEVPVRCACVEYNASYPATMAFEAPYDASAIWDGSNFYGASLKAMEGIGREKGLLLVGCDITGTNAFFVAHEIAGGKFADPYDAETHYEPARYQLLKMRGHPRAP